MESRLTFGVRQKLDEFPVELLRTLFIRQVPDAGKDNRLNIREMLGQWLHGRNVHCRILASPHQQRGYWLELWQQRLQIPQIGRPSLNNAQRMVQESRNRHRHRVAFKDPCWNPAAVGVEAAVPVRK